jgi:hypothetical protein
MFCPSCGKESRANQHFCKSCGCDLGVVSQALSSKTSHPPLSASQTSVNPAFDFAAYNKQLSRAYKELGTGAGVMIAVLFVVFMVHERWMPWAMLGLMIWGCSSLGTGISKLIAANQMKRNSQFLPQTPVQQPAFRAPTTSDLPQYAPPQVQPSVTEQTTRKLENQKQ